MTAATQTQVLTPKIRRVVYLDPGLNREIEEVLLTHYGGAWGGWQVFIARAIQAQIRIDNSREIGK